MIYGLLGLLLCIGIPAISGIYFACCKKGTLVTFFVGMLTFVITQLVLRLPILNLLSSRWDWFSLLPVSSPYLYAAILAFSAGIFEETGRLIGLKYIRRGKTDWMNGLAFGLGHGGIEAIWVASLGLLPALFNGTLSMAGIQGLAIGLERLCAILFHMAMTMLVLHGIRCHSLWGWFLAVLIHGIFDLTVVVQQPVFLWTVLAVTALSSLFYLLWTKKHWTTKKEITL
ncbi:MAG: YhfC family glutamic-type intramembrane protease [Blautia sp.]|jgi:uncharacterized membrane protein YhfC